MLVRFRRASLLAAVALLTSAGVAQATVTTSTITFPGTGFMQSNDNPPATQLTVTGNSTGVLGDKVDIRCWYGAGQNQVFVTNVPVGLTGSFSATAPLRSIAGHACRLRAEPAGVTTESAAFDGPVLAVSTFASTSDYTISGGPNNGSLYDYYANGTTFSSYAGWDSAGDCGPFLAPFDSSFGSPKFALSCNGALFGNDGFSRSEITADGHNACDVAAAHGLFGRTGACPPNCNGSQDNAGFPPLTVSQSWNPLNGFESTQSTEGIVKCTGADPYKPINQAACPAFQPSGLALERSTSMSQAGRSVTITDTWSSTDGHAHTVDLLYDDHSNGSAPGFEFPGQTGFSQHVTADTLPGSPAAPGTIFVKSNINAAGGDLSQSIGAITFSSAPSGYVFSSAHDFEEHQVLTVPAGGSAKLTYVYSAGYTLAQVRALAFAAQDQFKSPAVRITSPGNGSRSKKRTVAVSGTASAGSGISSLTLDGKSFGVAASGFWQASVTLKVGTNALVVTAADNAGQKAKAQVSVLYGCVVPKTKGLSEKSAKKRLRKASCTVTKVEKVHSHVKRGKVAGTRPGKGSKLRVGKKLQLLVSEGP